MGPWGDILVLLCLTLLNGFFASAEIAIVAVRKTRLRELADEGSSAAAAALRLRDDPERFLAIVQVAASVLAATAGAFGGVHFSAPLADRLASLGAGRAAAPLAFTIVVAFVAFLSIVVGELVPKSLALRSTERVALRAARPLLALAGVARPLVSLLTASSDALLRPFGDSTTFAEARLSPDELQQLVDEAASAGALDERAGAIASRALDLAHIRVGAIMVPRREVVALAPDAAPDRLLALLTERPHTRYPVVAGDLDGVLGYVTAREVLLHLASDGAIDLTSLVRAIPCFAEQTPAVVALRDLQGRRAHLGVVVDEQGTVAGIVTVEDIMEELVGEIVAEHDRGGSAFQHESDGAVVLAAATPVHQVNRELGITLPETGAYATLAGLLLTRTGNIPHAGETVALPGGIEAEILDATSRQIRSVRLRLHRDARPA